MKTNNYKQFIYQCQFIAFLIKRKYIFIKSFIISKAEYYSRPITYRIINYTLLYKLRHWSKVNKYYIINRWWNFKHLNSLRLYKERYKKNMKIIAQRSEDSHVPQHVILSQYKDLGQWELTYYED